MNKIDFSPKDELAFEKLNNYGPLGKRALFIFQHLFLREDFRSLVAEVRPKLDIPSTALEPKTNLEHRKIFEERFLDYGGLRLKCMTAFCESTKKSKLNYLARCKTTLMQTNSSISLQI